MNVSDTSCFPGSTERVSEAMTDAEGVIAKTDGHEFPCPFSTETPTGVELEPSNRSQQTGVQEKDVHTLDSLADCASSGPTLDSLPARAEQEVPPSEGHAHRIPPEGRQERGVADGRAAVLLQSYFAACEDETPTIQNHDRVLQRLCEHLDHALLYGLQDISSGYWVLVLHFTRREAIKQIEELQHIATNMGRSRAWLYLALSESSLESYLRLFQENRTLLHKYYFKNALVCSDDHLTLFLTLVSGLEFIRFNLDLDVPYLDLAPYMPDYYKPQNLLDFEERLPSSDSLSLNSFNSITSTNLEWDDSAIAPSSEDYDFGDMFPAPQSVPSVNWEEGDLTDSVSCPRSAACEPPLLEVAVRNPTLRYNPFNEESDTATSTEVTPVHHNSRDRSDTAEDDTESTGTELEVIRLARRRKPCKKKQGKVEPVSNHMSSSGLESRGQEELSERESGDTQEPLVERGGPEDSLALPEEDVGDEGLRLPEMTDISMDSVGQPLREVMDQLNGALDTDRWRTEEPDGQQPFRESSGGEPPDPPLLPLDQGLLQTPPPNNFYRFTPESPGPASPGGGHYDPAGDGQPPHVLGGHEGEGAGEVQTGEAREAARPLEERRVDEGEEEVHNGAHLDTDNSIPDSPKPIPGQGPPKHCVIEEDEPNSPSEVMHPAEFRVDNNHLLLLMIHVFRENEEQLFKMIRMSTGHMEGNMQLLYLLFTDCYIYLLRKGRYGPADSHPGLYEPTEAIPARYSRRVPDGVSAFEL
ncbi:UNVERIFIED_CONTAM: hypothetical protein FKN15_046384 [Acipenser sinensis]